MRSPKLLLTALAVAPVMLSAEIALAWAPLDGSQPVWATLPQTYRVNQSTIPSSIAATGLASLDAGYAQWMMPSCTSYSAQNLGNTTSGANYNDGQNVLRWISNSWPQMYGPVNQVIGVTLPVYFNGPITDADISFNNVGFCWNDTGSGGCVDTKSIATHEEGHSLGLGHTPVNGATMFASYAGGTSIASIEQDDIDGVCALYPGTGPGSSGVGVASSSAASSGSGGGQTCDQCSQSESSGGACTSQYNACTSSTQCNNFYDCAFNCMGNQTCVQNCASMYPTGAQIYSTWRDCVCGVCVTECAMECGGSGASSSSSAVAGSSVASSGNAASSSAAAGVGGAAGSSTASGWGTGGEAGGGNSDTPGDQGSCSCHMQSRGVGAGALSFLAALGAVLARKRRPRRP